MSASASSDASPDLRSHVTLVLCALLHAFTHAYGTLLVPLYLMMTTDLRLAGVSRASAVVTVYGMVYCIISFKSGVYADRWNRKALLGIGLVGNAIAITAMGLTRSYEMLMVWGVIAGIFGALFHPAANALVPAHYPKSPGMAIGFLGMGSGLGFFLGPQYAGWRAQNADWYFASVANWQRPLVEAGLAGLILGIIFLLVAREVHSRNNGQPTRPMAATLRRQITKLALIMGCRDFAGIATISLASIYLQKAHGLDAKRTGFILGAMMLVSVIINPVAVYLSPGKRRLPLLTMVMICGGIVVATVPLWNVRYILPVLTTFMSFQLSSYAISDAAMLERVPAEMRGRVVGLFLTIAGTFSSTAPFFMGWWTDHLGPRAVQPSAYIPLFGALAAMMWVSPLASPVIAQLGPPQGPAIEPLSETGPATAEPVL
jgi:MFS family permease